MATPETPSTTVVRPAVSADGPALGRLGTLLVAIHHGFDPDRFIAPTASTPELYAGFLDTQLHKPEAIVLVAEHRGSVVGYAYAALEGADFMALRGPAGVLYDLIVDPDHRGAGAGRQLVEAVLAELADRGAPRVVLFTAARNAGAQQLFARLGFRQTMIEMTLELSSADGAESRNNQLS